MSNLSGYINIVPIVQPASGVATVTPDYVQLDKYDKVIFIVEAGSGLTCTGQITASLQSAYSATGGGAAAIGVYTTMGTTAANTITNAQALLVDNASSWDASETVVINDITFTMMSTSVGLSTTLTTALFDSNRYIHSSSGMTNPAGAVEHLAAYVNHATYGCTGLYAAAYGNPVATASSNNVYITGHGEKTITAVASATDIQLIPVRWVSVLETNGAELLANTSHKFVTCVLTCTSASHVSVTAIRSGLRYSSGPEGHVTDYDFGV